MIKKILLLAMLLSLFPHYSSAAVRLIIEAEEFNGLARYPYHKENAAGWYARESNCRHYGAPGRGWHAQVHASAQNLVAQKQLPQSLPPGKYKIFIRVIGHYWHDKGNAVEIDIGGARVNFEWEYIKRFKWLPGKNIHLEAPADVVYLKALKFGGKAFKHINDTNKRTISIDTIYITSDLSEKTGPTGEAASMIETGREFPVELLSKDMKSNRRKVRQAETPAPLEKPRPIPIILKSYDGRKNMWPNSSFEIGGGDGWAAENHPGYAHIFDERDHIKGGAFHGGYHRLVPAMSRGMSRPYLLVEKGLYTLSLYLKGEKKQPVDISLVRIVKNKKGQPVFKEKKKIYKSMNIRTNIPRDWKRVSKTAKLDPGFYMLKVESKADCHIDAVQFEPGEKATKYMPRAKIEAGISVSGMGNILYDDKPLELIAWASNSSDQEVNSSLQFIVTDVRERIIIKKALRFTAPASSTISQKIVIPDSPVRGIFSTYYAAQGRRNPAGELVFSVLPKLPDHIPRHALACNMDNLEEVHALMARMGHKWQLYCKLKKDRPGSLNKKPGRFDWKGAEKAITLASKNGYQTLPALWPSRLPAHLKNKELSSPQSVGDGSRDVVRRTSTKKIPHMPDLEKWRSYCREIGVNLGDVAPLWAIEDETEMYYSPREFARILEATVKGFKDSGKTIKTALSCTPDFIEETIEESGGKVLFNALGASSYNFEYWEAVKVRGLQNQYGLPWFCIGVGQGGQPQMNHSYPGYTPVYASAARTAREMVLLCLAQDAKVIGHYTGRIWSRGGLFNTDVPLMGFDGSPLPHGFSYSCIPLLLADAVPIKDIYIPSLDTMVFVYEQNGKLGAVTWANNTPNLDIHWKTWPRTIKDFILKGNVDVRDMYGNPRRDIKTGEAEIKLDLTEEPVFILNKGMTRDQFMEMFEKASAPPPPVEMRLAFAPDGKGGVDLGLFARNNTQGKLDNPKLDADFPPDRMVTKTSWMLPDRSGTISSIPEGETVMGRIKTAVKLEYPVENATISVWLTDGDQEHPWYERCWMTVAPKRSIKIDGGAGDWQGVHPAWIYHTFSWGRFGRAFPQIVSGAEHLKYVNRVDARLAIYTAHDEKYLYIALDCRDNDPSLEGRQDRRDRFSIMLKPDYYDNFSFNADAKGLKIELVPGRDNVSIKGVKGASGAIKTTPRGFIIELALPLEVIKKGKLKPGHAVGFDLVWTDFDNKGHDRGTTVLRWAGGSRTMGQLFFAK